MPERRRRTDLARRYKRRRTEQGTFVCDGCGYAPPLGERVAFALLHAHHVVPLWIGGADAEGNLALLCGTCHLLAHADNQRPGDVPAGAPLVWLGATTAAELREEFAAVRRLDAA